MARHVITIPDLMAGRELRTIVWDNEAGTVEGTHYDIEYIQRIFDAPKPVTAGDPGLAWDLTDPAHDPAQFLVLLWVSYNGIRREPLRSTLPPIFDGVDFPPGGSGETLYDEDGNIL